MEGKVIISLRDYEELKRQKEMKNFYSGKAQSYISMLERLEMELYDLNANPVILSQLDEVINSWYD